MDLEFSDSPSGLGFCQFKGFCLYIGHGGTVNCKRNENVTKIGNVEIFHVKSFYSQWLQTQVRLQGCRQFVKIVESSIRKIIQRHQKALQFVLTKFRTCAVRHNPKFDNTNEIHDISSNDDFLNNLWDEAYHVRWNRVEEFHAYLRISVKSTKCHYFQKVTNLFCLCWRCTRKRGIVGIHCFQSRNLLPVYFFSTNMKEI